MHGSSELQIAGLPVPDLRVDAQDGAQGGKALRQDRPEPVLLDAVGHDELFYMHGMLLSAAHSAIM